MPIHGLALAAGRPCAYLTSESGARADRFGAAGSYLDVHHRYPASRYPSDLCSWQPGRKSVRRIFPPIRSRLRDVTQRGNSVSPRAREYEPTAIEPGGGATCSTKPRLQARSRPAACRSSSSSRATNRQLPRRTGRRPLRPRRCRKAATVDGESHLDDPVQVPDVDAELQRGRGHDDAVPALGERLLGTPPLVQGQRGVHQVRGHPARQQLGAEHLDQSLGIRRTPGASRPGTAGRLPWPRSGRFPRSQAGRPAPVRSG